MLLSFALDDISDYYDSDDNDTFALVNSGAVATPDLSDLTVYDMSIDAMITRDEDIFVEYYEDTTGESGYGILVRWVTDPFLDDTDDEFAFIKTTTGGTAYARYEHIHPICEIEGYNNNVPTLIPLPMRKPSPFGYALSEERASFRHMLESYVRPLPATSVCVAELAVS